MRGYKKFLFRNTWHVFPCFFKNRILNFKRTKWKKIKSRILYTNRQYKWYKKIVFSSKFSNFLKSVTFLKKKVRSKALNLNKKFIRFLKQVKRFLIAKKYKNFRHKLNQRMKGFESNPLYVTVNYFKDCFNLFFLDQRRLEASHKYHLRYRFFFKNRLLMKSSVLKYYYGCFNIKFFKKAPFAALYKDNVACTFLKPEFRLDILLWRLKFFSSPYLARFAFQNKQILLNSGCCLNKVIKKHYYKIFLKKGDLVSFTPNFKYKYRAHLKSYAKNFYLPTTLEFDYYTNTIVLLKDLEELNFKDITSILKEPLALYQFRNFLLK